MAALGVSVVICTRNRPAALRRCISSVCAQSDNPKEIIIIDDGESEPELLDDLATQVERVGIRWSYVRKSDSGLTRSRNLGLSCAEEEIIQFFDDDAEPAYHFIREVLALFSADVNGDIAIVGGTVIEPKLAGLGGRMWRLASRVAGWWSLGRRGMRRGHWPGQLLARQQITDDLNVVGAALAVRKSVVFPPGFDESLTGYALGEDREISYRMSRTHFVGIATRARAVHHMDQESRPDPGRLGYAAAYNYCYILSKNVPMGIGEWVVVAWSLLVLAAYRLALAVVDGDRRHLAELRGMVRGSTSWIHHVLTRAG